MMSDDQIILNIINKLSEYSLEHKKFNDSWCILYHPCDSIIRMPPSPWYVASLKIDNGLIIIKPFDCVEFSCPIDDEDIIIHYLESVIDRMLRGFYIQK